MLATVYSTNPNLVAKDFSIDPAPYVPNGQYRVSVVVANDSSLAYGDYFGVSLKIARNGAPASEFPREFYRYIPKLDPKGIETINFATPWIPTQNGTYTATLCVDRFKPITDADPSDDCLPAYPITVSDATAGLRTGPSPANTGTVTFFYGDAGGRVSDTVTTQQIPTGSEITLMATPNADMQLSSWTGEESNRCRYPNGDRSICVVTVTALTRIQAAFVPKPAGLMGDVDDNNVVNASDALAVFRVAVGQTVTPFVQSRADVDCNGTITAGDALAVLRASVGSITLDCAQAAASKALTGDVAFAKTGTGTGNIAVTSPTMTPNNYVTKLQYSATPQAGSTFTGWEGDCTGTSPCTVSISGMKSARITARFEKVTPQTPTCTNLPQNATGYPAPDNTGLTANKPYVYSANNTGAKCEYTCTAPNTWNGSACTTGVTPPPSTTDTDLSPFGGGDLRVSPVKVYAGRAINVLAKFRNTGNTQSPTTRTSLRIDKDNNNTWDFATADSLPFMKKNQTRAIKFKRDYTPPTAGTYRYQVCVNDTALALDQTLTTAIPEFSPGTGESNTTNNCVSSTFTVLPPRTGAAATLGGMLIMSGIVLGAYALAKRRVVVRA